MAKRSKKTKKKYFLKNLKKETNLQIEKRIKKFNLIAIWILKLKASGLKEPW